MKQYINNYRNTTYFVEYRKLCSFLEYIRIYNKEYRTGGVISDMIYNEWIELVTPDLKLELHETI